MSKRKINVVVTDANGGILSAMNGSARKATITIQEGDVKLERTYHLPSGEEGMSDDEVAVLRDVFVLNRWKELVVNFFPGLVGMPGGPDLEQCEVCGQPIPVKVDNVDNVDNVESVGITDAGREFAASGQSFDDVKRDIPEEEELPYVSARLIAGDGTIIDIPRAKMTIDQHEGDGDDDILSPTGILDKGYEVTFKLEPVPDAVGLLFGVEQPEVVVDLHMTATVGNRTGRTQRLLETARRR